ncbi:MAG: hypothetical protein IH863_07380 [Chloroflexi bacterium]|nr:hypothetical protein [Chloroflexota bacterium]
MTQDQGIDDVVDAHAKAILTMDIAKIMDDLMPEPMMKLQEQAGGGTALQIDSYEILGHTREGDDYWYDVKYIGPPSFTVHARWSEVGGAWKIVDADITVRG